MPQCEVRPKPRRPISPHRSQLTFLSSQPDSSLHCQTALPTKGWPGWVDLFCRVQSHNCAIYRLVVYWVHSLVASWVNSLGVSGRCSFSTGITIWISDEIETDRCKFLTKKDTLNFNLAPKFFLKRKVLTPNFAFLDKKFRTKRFSDNFLSA